MKSFWNVAWCAACMHVCVEVTCLCLLVYIHVCIVFQAERFSPEQEEVFGCQENSVFSKETCLRALLQGATHDSIHTRSLSL